jgi:hypothetical protein
MKEYVDRMVFSCDKTYKTFQNVVVFEDIVNTAR